MASGIRTYDTEAERIRAEIAEKYPDVPGSSADPPAVPVADPPQAPTGEPSTAPAQPASDPPPAPNPQPQAGDEPGETDQQRVKRSADAFKRLNGQYSSLVTAMREGRDVEVVYAEDGVTPQAVRLFTRPRQPQQVQPRQPAPQAAEPPRAPAKIAERSAAVKKYLDTARETYGDQFAIEQEAAIRALAEAGIAEAIENFRSELAPVGEVIQRLQAHAASQTQSQEQQDQATFEREVSREHADWKTLVGASPDGTDADQTFLEWLYGHPMAGTWVPMMYPQKGQQGALVDEFCYVLSEFRKSNPRDVAAAKRLEEEKRRKAAAAGSVRPDLQPAPPPIAGDVQPMTMGEVRQKQKELANKPEELRVFLDKVEKAQQAGQLYG